MITKTMIIALVCEIGTVVGSYMVAEDYKVVFAIIGYLLFELACSAICKLYKTTKYDWLMERS